MRVVVKNLVLVVVMTGLLGACGLRFSDNSLFITEGGKPATRTCPALDAGFLTQDGRRITVTNHADYKRTFNVNLAERQPLKVRLYDASANASVSTGMWGMYVSCVPSTSQPSWDAKKTEFQNELAVFEWQKANPSLYGQVILARELSYDQSTTLTVDIVLNQIFDPTMAGGPDADHDGVPDNADQCPTIPRGTMPDPQKLGCPIVSATPPTPMTSCTGIGVPAAGFENFVCWLTNGEIVPVSADLTQAKGVWHDTGASKLPAIVRLNTDNALSTDATTFDAQGAHQGTIANMLSGTWYALPIAAAVVKSNYPSIGFRLLTHTTRAATLETDCPTSMIAGISGAETCQP